MTKEEVACVKEVIENAELKCSKYPKRLEIRIPKAKFPGIYLSVPTDGKSFKLQVYLNQIGIAYLEKLNLREYNVTGDDMNRFFSIYESKTIPTDTEIAEILDQALEGVVHIGIVKEQALVS